MHGDSIGQASRQAPTRVMFIRSRNVHSPRLVVFKTDTSWKKLQRLYLFIYFSWSKFIYFVFFFLFFCFVLYSKPVHTNGTSCGGHSHPPSITGMAVAADMLTADDFEINNFIDVNLPVVPGQWSDLVLLVHITSRLATSSQVCVLNIYGSGSWRVLKTFWWK